MTYFENESDLGALHTRMFIHKLNGQLFPASSFIVTQLVVLETFQSLEKQRQVVQE